MFRSTVANCWHIAHIQHNINKRHFFIKLIDNYIMHRILKKYNQHNLPHTLPYFGRRYSKYSLPGSKGEGISFVRLGDKIFSIMFRRTALPSRFCPSTKYSSFYRWAGRHSKADSKVVLCNWKWVVWLTLMS